ncbi:MAG: hypothetical protein A2312_02480 [Candidatus Staskawiczbacteria bacterium RIFOXYB2_FULL_32_9]|uniref:Helicase ATP-binding domain-containing protein n=1 Tax=Candidatus Staskawiczbacteria bacterium RIFOXYD1_FULL_32_13 TaxID=1802234 RepID=A0A1G2JKV7_9BACT|nr:MAG: Type III restriction enzyme, res subunit [Parcubacteria group bacterium GW2011_GWC2_32_10]OGZ78226.1 MAG: hypothetical protein A2360_01440 [Candidatus Staskawiczbacteria bacterium RIFOXYB1_FULL_32_11]OGZ82904.1 MAG: hypothetical protein A2312_02480 [Candidatus Staskawiczbacteria bacterium RIFOXYB2_FULL_32_9]OGZ85905.1 MAG: hypothetical protein A2463_02135 [Candidatus Staskawiczbacteria bacterium RIFOXYC2_FULL_32_10]OGZ87593.1 MAG: hypothetical protein A2561_03950 [Candidatus Staskawiczb
MQLKIYQENAIDELLEKAKKLLEYAGNKKLVFKAPTGSGKTIMMAEFLKRLVDDKEIKQQLSFIWAAPRQLHTQSKDKLENYFETSRALKCSNFEDLDDRKIDLNEILFFNWESINRTDNIYIRDNEQEFNLSKVLERTKEEGLEIVLIIDEAHHHATSEISQGLIRMINPKITVEVSATPTISDEDEKVVVQIEEVKIQGMIKKAVILNDDCKNIEKGGKVKSELEKASDELVIEKAMIKRQEILNAYKKEGTNINPLVLIQLPDRVGSLEDRAKERVIAILKDKYKITTEKGNNKLAIWLSGEHINKEDVEKQDSEVEVLIFKQAIALGWDCPRAQILVLFRNWHDPIFSIQTVGRIMRMPEPEKGHYKSDVLNYGYVFTNIENVEIKEDIARGYITVNSSRRIEKYEPVDLLSCYSVRHREKTRIKPMFINMFIEEAKKYKLKTRIDKNAKKIDIKIIADATAESADSLAGKTFIGDKSINLGGFDLKKYFDYFVRERVQAGPTSFYPEDRSVGNVEEGILRYFEKEMKMEFGDGEDIVLAKGNTEHFSNVIEATKKVYKDEVEKREKELKLFENWNVPEKLSFSEDYISEDRKKSVMTPYYVKYKSELEKKFADFLDKQNNIDWWFKNGDRDMTFFAVPYSETEKHPFYVDFVVKMKNGKIGLFDPHGTHLGDFKEKSDGLHDYIKIENKKGNKLFGGIVANTDTRNYDGKWIYFDKSGEEFDKNNFDNWSDLELFS